MPGDLTRHTLALTLSGDVREDTFEGRPHLVAPVTAVREMVLGGDGGELLLAEEIQASADLWEGTLLTIGHPSTNANQRHVAEAHGVGRLFNVTANGELRGEMWLDLTRTGDVEGAELAVEKLREGAENGEPTLEVSTAYLAALDPEGGVHDGTRYSGVQRGIVPEHLALLPDQTGKCSIEDGCGAPRRNVLATARTPDFSGTSSAEWSAPTLEDYVSALDLGDVEAVSDLTEEQAREITGRTLLGDPAAESFRDLSFFPVVEPSTGELNENALRAVISGRGSQADISADALASAQGMARTLLEEHFDVELEENVDSRTLLERGLDAVRRAFDGLAGRDNQDEVSAESRREMLENEISEQFGGPDTFTWVRATFSDEVIFALEDPGDEVGLFRIGYEIDDEAGTVTLTGEPVEVKETVSFEPVENRESNMNRRTTLGASGGGAIAEAIAARAGAEEMDLEDVRAEAGEAAGIDASTVAQIEAGEIDCPPLDRLEGFAGLSWMPALSTLRSAFQNDGCSYDTENTMETRDDVINALADCEDHPFDEKRLNAMSGETLLAVAQARQLNLDEGLTPDDLEPEGEEGEPEEKPAAESAELSAEDAAFVRELREAGADPEAVSRAVTRMNAEADAEAEKREELVSRLNSSEDCEFTEEELRNLRTETLERLAEPQPRRSYLGQGGARSNTETDSYVDRNPSTPRVSEAIRNARGID